MWIIFSLVVVFLIFIICSNSSDKPKEININSSRPSRTTKNYSSTHVSTIYFIDHSKDGGTYVPVPVVGIRYRDNGTIDRAARLVDKELIKLIPEPDNPHDKDAVKVVTSDDIHIGYLPSEVAFQIRDYMDSYVDCFVYSVTNDAIPRVKIRPFFKVQTPLYLDWMINNPWKAKDIIDNKYPGYSDNVCLKDLYTEKYTLYLKELLEKFPNELYFKYLWLKDLIDLMKWEEAKEIADELINDYAMSTVPSMLRYSLICTDGINYKVEKELKKQLKEWSAEAYSLIEIEEYIDAADLLYKCYYLGMHTPKVVRSLCKCFKEGGDYRELEAFAYNEKDKSFLSEATRDFLFKCA